MTSPYTVVFSEAAQVSLHDIPCGRLVGRLIERALSIPRLTVMCEPLGDHPTLRVINVAGYAVYFRFALDHEPSGFRYVSAVCVPESEPPG